MVNDSAAFPYPVSRICTGAGCRLPRWAEAKEAVNGVYGAGGLYGEGAVVTERSQIEPEQGSHKAGGELLRNGLAGEQDSLAFCPGFPLAIFNGIPYHGIDQTHRKAEADAADQGGQQQDGYAAGRIKDEDNLGKQHKRGAEKAQVPFGYSA